MQARNTVRDLRKIYTAGTPITMVTCYDYTFARLVERAGADIILVGDSLGNVIQGHETTLPVELDDILYHSRAVARGNQRAHILADLPFMSYQASEEDAMRAAGELLKRGGAQSVKLEGGEHIAPIVERLTRAGVPVCGHLGLTPQSVHAMGGYLVQGRSEEAAKRLVRDAQSLEAAGAFMIVLEMIPTPLARAVTEAVDVPTIGIGAGNVTDGQVLVLYDLLGMNPDFHPKFLKRYAHLDETITDALTRYKQEVVERSFPGKDQSFEK